MEELINPETAKLENGISIENGFVKVEIIWSMFDGKMAAILSGAGGASCQMCTATHDELKDRDLVVDSFPLTGRLLMRFSYLENLKISSLSSLFHLMSATI